MAIVVIASLYVFFNNASSSLRQDVDTVKQHEKGLQQPWTPSP
jgi:hypothetical protein